MEIPMETKAGLWIDHRQAVVVLITDTGEEIKQIMSNAEKQLRRTGSTPLQGNFDPQHVPSDDSRLRTFTAELNSFYNEVIDSVRDAESILIFGPGEAKDELKKCLEGNNLGDRITAIETVDNMTTPQIAAKVRQYFAG
jgi:stalled ribosome rescue protein Dom34